MIDTPGPRGDSSLIPIFERSSLVQRAHRIGGLLDRAYRRSRWHALVTPVNTHWQSLARPDRLRALGLTLITAATVHVGLLLTQVSTPDWRRLVIPLLAMAEGALLALMAKGGGH